MGELNGDLYEFIAKGMRLVRKSSSRNYKLWMAYWSSLEILLASYVCLCQVNMRPQVIVGAGTCFSDFIVWPCFKAYCLGLILFKEVRHLSSLICLQPNLYSYPSFLPISFPLPFFLFFLELKRKLWNSSFQEIRHYRYSCCHLYIPLFPQR